MRCLPQLDFLNGSVLWSFGAVTCAALQQNLLIPRRFLVPSLWACLCGDWDDVTPFLMIKDMSVLCLAVDLLGVLMGGEFGMEIYNGIELVSWQ